MLAVMLRSEKAKDSFIPEPIFLFIFNVPAEADKVRERLEGQRSVLKVKLTMR